MAVAFNRGTSLEVTAVTARGPRTFRSSVQYMDLDNMWVEPPAEEPVEGLAAGAELTVVAEKGGWRYSSKVRFKEFASKPEPLWKMDRPKSMERSRGRAVVRQQVKLPGSVLRVEHVGREDIEGLEFTVNVVDVSTGGAQFESLVEILEGEDLLHTLVLPLPHLDEPMEVVVKLLDSRKISTATKNAILYRARFPKPSSKLASEITRHLNELQLDSRGASDSPRAKAKEEPFPLDQGIKSLRIGNKITMECYLPAGNVESFFTTIQDITDEGISVLGPLYRGGAVAIDAAKEITIVGYNQRSNALVVGRTKRLAVSHEPLFMWRLAMPAEFFTRHQRSHVRMKVALDSTLSINDPNADPPISAEFDVILADLSAGGAAFHSHVRLPPAPNATYEISFALEGARMPFEIRVGVVGEPEIRKLADRQAFSYKCKFLNISERRQDEITKYIFSEQLKQRRRGIA